MHIEKVFYLENPEAGIKKFATESQIRVENIVKDVFGVATIGDLPMMIKYNKKFQGSVCDVNQIKPSEITVDLIFRVATKNDLLPLKIHYQQLKEHNNQDADTPPFNTVIQLGDGIFQWDDSTNSYIKMESN
nr:hypothetical protein [Mesobacillus foraminis]